MNNNTIIAVVATFVIAGSVGYTVGKNSVNVGALTKDKQDSIVMMKKQFADIKQMSEMMKSGGLAMQELGEKYKDDMMMSKGKDMQMIGQKYMSEDADATRGNNTMNQMMGN
ncbi:MAG: hypothetical protein HZA36_00255 [Parcubacteria group bacterium]|nr:hypothetical protein [Parcubacteria group bacterium]